MKHHGIVDAESTEVGKARNPFVTRGAVDLEPAFDQRVCEIGSVLSRYTKNQCSIGTEFHKTVPRSRRSNQLMPLSRSRRAISAPATDKAWCSRRNANPRRARASASPGPS